MGTVTSNCPRQSGPLFICGAEADDGGVTFVLLATALLGLQPPDQPLTAGQLYAGCVRHLSATGPANPDDYAAIYCDATAAVEEAAADALAAVLEAGGGPDERSSCPPEHIRSATGPNPFIQV